jgi:glucose/arabinose dehydrogenase
MHRNALGLMCGMLLLMGSSGFAAENELSESEKKAGWMLLFDGKSAENFRNYKQPKLSAGWTVKDGALNRSANGAGDIVTKEQYDSFELSIEYKISKGGNSGIMFHVQETEGPPYVTGPEIQVQDNVNGRDPQKSGWLYQLYSPGPDWASGKVPDATRPVGEWNALQIRITPRDCEINMNGVRYAKFQKGSDEWNKLVAKSKFASMPNFGKATKGFICLQDHGDAVSYRNIKVRKLGEDGSAPEPIDGTLKLSVELAFPDLQYVGWSPEDKDGRVQNFRPILLTNAGDGSNRVFVASQLGQIYSFENRPDVKESKLFLDISDRVQYKDNENEEGLLGLAFHPKFKQNGELYIYYVTKSQPHTAVVSQFKVSPDNPNLAKADSEVELLRVTQPFWNHKGGTLAFGPDGYLYVALGDGGAANDPFENGQNLNSLLGKILRIDVDHKEAGKNYAIPKDNPFVGKEKALPEIYAFGLRNIWRMAFDRKTGDLWCADVGQNLWEEINLITKGGNYGWSVREAMHPFGLKASGPRPDLIDPIWEYDHQIGLSITGGLVYRGTQIPELVGKYIYADYVTGKIWALHYDTAAKKVITNEAIPSDKLPIISFGDDEKGEIYFTMVSANGKGVYKFKK